jgi:hypothetical protein
VSWARRRRWKGRAAATRKYALIEAFARFGWFGSGLRGFAEVGLVADADDHHQERIKEDVGARCPGRPPAALKATTATRIKTAQPALK